MEFSKKREMASLECPWVFCLLVSFLVLAGQGDRKKKRIRQGKKRKKKGKVRLTTLVPHEGSLGFFPSKGPP